MCVICLKIHRTTFLNLKMKDDLKQVFVEKEKIFLNKLNFLKRIGKQISKLLASSVRTSDLSFNKNQLQCS